MTDKDKSFHKPLGINQNEKKANKLRKNVEKNLNAFVKDEQLSKAELTLFDKIQVLADPVSKSAINFYGGFPT